MWVWVRVWVRVCGCVDVCGVGVGVRVWCGRVGAVWCEWNHLSVDRTSRLDFDDDVVQSQTDAKAIRLAL